MTINLSLDLEATMDLNNKLKEDALKQLYKLQQTMKVKGKQFKAWVVGSAVIILGDSVQYTVEQSFFTKRFKLAEQRWRAYTWGGVRVALRIFCKCS